MLEAEDIISTNPLFLTNREDALTPKGREQVRQACARMKGSYPTVVKYSLAASCIDTADLVGAELKITRDRIIPEFTFLDPRGLGQWDMLSYKKVEPSVFALDQDEAGPDGTGGRPPPNDDGTPHETLADQAVRLRQIVSILETQYSGDTILLVFPDGTGPALLSCMFAGIPYNRVHELEYDLGELRLDVTKESTLRLLQERAENRSRRDAYQTYLDEGRANLQELREQKEFINKKDIKMEQERVAIEKAYQEKEERRQQAREREEAARRQRAEELARRQENAKEVEMARRERVGTSGSDSVSLFGSVAAVGAAAAVRAVQRGGEAEAPGNETAIHRTSSTDSPPNVPAVNVTQVNTTTIVLPKTTLPPRVEPIAATDDPDSALQAIVTGPRPPSTKEKRERAAQVAMELYMEQDDGGDDWLRSIGEILNSTDDDAFQ